MFTPMLVAFGCGVLGQLALHHFSLFVGRRELHVHGWIVAWCVTAMAMQIARMTQFYTESAAVAVTCMRLAVTLAIVLSFVLTGVLVQIGGGNRRRVLRVVGAVAALELLVHTTTEAFVTSRAWLYTDALGQSFYWVDVGPLFLVLGPYALGLLVYAVFTLRRAERADPVSANVVLVACVLYAALALHDALLSQRVFDSTPLFIELSSIVLAIAFDAVAVRHAQSLYVNLETEVVTRTKHLEVMAEKLSIVAQESVTAAHAKESFLAHMSHELRTPMNGVLGMTRLLLDTDLNADQRLYAETVGTSGQMMLTIVDDILDLSKIEAGQLRVDALELDVATVVEDVGTLLAERAHRAGLELTVVVDDQVPSRVLADAGRMRQVLTNLVGNAVKFTEQGVVALRVSLRADEGAEWLDFTVTDTGVGIAEDQLNAIFSPFTQADGSPARRFGGTGLGLTISKQLAELMGGTLQVTSVSGEGSTFVFTLPCNRAPDHVEPSFPRLSGMPVLIVCEPGDVLTMLEQFGRHLGLACVAAGPTPTAVARAVAAQREQARAFRVALVDVPVAAAPGAVFLPALEGIPCVALAPIHRVVEVGALPGVAACIPKPLREKTLAETLTRLVRSGRPSIVQEAIPHHAESLSGRVLLVEDNEVNQLVARTMLTQMGLHVDVAAEGSAALSALAEHAYDLVFMDCQMPGMDGFEATECIRASAEPWRNVTIVAMTANVLQRDRERCFAVGMNDHVAKPLQRDDLVATVHKWLSEGSGGAP